MDAGVVDAGADAGLVVIDAGPPIPKELSFAIDFLGIDGGLSTVQSSAVDAQIDPAKTVLVLFSAPLKDFRVRILDGAEKVVVSDDEARLEDGGLSYKIVLADPLKPGRSYTFSLDAELGHEITDLGGHGYRDVLIPLKVRGEPEPEPKPKKPTRKRKR